VRASRGRVEATGPTCGLRSGLARAPDPSVSDRPSVIPKILAFEIRPCPIDVPGRAGPMPSARGPPLLRS